MISVDEAVARITAAFAPLSVETRAKVHKATGAALSAVLAALRWRTLQRGVGYEAAL